MNSINDFKCELIKAVRNNGFYYFQPGEYYYLTTERQTKHSIKIPIIINSIIDPWNKIEINIYVCGRTITKNYSYSQLEEFTPILIKDELEIMKLKLKGLY
jgi:hypothetical protein